MELLGAVCKVVQVMGSTDSPTRQDDHGLDELLASLLSQKTDGLGGSTPALDEQSAGQMISTACLEQLSGLGNLSWAHDLGASNRTRPPFTAL